MVPHLPSALGLDIPNFLPESVLGVGLDWLRPAGRLFWSSVVTFIAIAVLLVWTRKPKSPEPVTWAGAMAGAVAVFGLMILAFGTVPHEWLTFANSYLNWGKDQFIIENNPVVPFNVTKAVAADTIEVLIYGFYLVTTVVLLVMWQKRPVRKPEEAPAEAEARTETRTSAYGRPVTTTS